MPVPSLVHCEFCYEKCTKSQTEARIWIWSCQDTQISIWGNFATFDPSHIKEGEISRTRSVAKANKQSTAIQKESWKPSKLDERLINAEGPKTHAHTHKHRSMEWKQYLPEVRMKNWPGNHQEKSANFKRTNVSTREFWENSTVPHMKQNEQFKKLWTIRPAYQQKMKQPQI